MIDVRRFICSVLLLGLFSASKVCPAMAQAPAPAKDVKAEADLAAKVDPAKKAVIKQLLDLTKMSEKAASMQDLMLTQVRRSINILLQKSIAADDHYRDSQKKQMLDMASDASDRIINRYRELSQERINMPALMEQVAYKVYDESFTTSELQDIIAFYRTATGQKALKEMPEIMQRSMMLSGQLIQPKVIDIMREVTGEEFARLKRDAANAPAATSTTAPANTSTTTPAATSTTTAATTSTSTAATTATTNSGASASTTPAAPSSIPAAPAASGATVARPTK